MSTKVGLIDVMAAMYVSTDAALNACGDNPEYRAGFIGALRGMAKAIERTEHGPIVATFPEPDYGMTFAERCLNDCYAGPGNALLEYRRLRSGQ